MLELQQMETELWTEDEVDQDDMFEQHQGIRQAKGVSSACSLSTMTSPESYRLDLPWVQAQHHQKKTKKL
jgi:hypothetical protein